MVTLFTACWTEASLATEHRGRSKVEFRIRPRGVFKWKCPFCRQLVMPPRERYLKATNQEMVGGAVGVVWLSREVY